MRLQRPYAKRSLVKLDQIQSLDGNSPFLKVHMRDGRVYILSSWTVDQETPTVTGSGDVLSVNRDVVETGQFSISIDSVAIFETNVVQSSPGVAALTVITGVSVALTAYCHANPKSCFGSCPTFMFRTVISAFSQEKVSRRVLRHLSRHSLLLSKRWGVQEIGSINLTIA